MLSSSSWIRPPFPKRMIASSNLAESAMGGGAHNDVDNKLCNRYYHCRGVEQPGSSLAS